METEFQSGMRYRVRTFDPKRIPSGLESSLMDDETQVWICDIASIEMERRILGGKERARANRLRQLPDRRRWINSRVALRMLLSSYVDIDPGEIQFAYGSHGKPYIAHPCTAVTFSSSRSGDFAAFAFRNRRSVGLDIECHAELELPEVKDVCSPNELALLTSKPESDRAAAFFEIWTRKEALAKCIGVGLSMPPDSFEVLGNTLLVPSPEGDPSFWTYHLESLEGPPGYSLALAQS